MKAEDLIDILDLEVDDILEIFDKSLYLKSELKKGNFVQPLKNKTLGMIFQKSSTRTRVSFEVGMYQLGGYALFLNANDLQLGRGETIKDTALTLSRYLDGIMIRTFNHQEVIDLANYASIPVINGLTDLAHPCQALGDIFTALEHLGDINKPLDTAKNLHLVFIGDGNNVANSLLALCAKIGMNFTICCPQGYEPNKEIVEQSIKIAKKTGSNILITNSLSDAIIKSADIFYTDVWVSMGFEKEAEERKKAFRKFQVNEELLKKSKSTVKTMHCLPARRGEEITDYGMDGPNSIIFDQAENRLHIQKGIMALLMS
ncbi:MAG TPA: ornithine carbamoyltransferase [bacterium]|nr:ornithine carbamoyltransferase [bacterium]HPQ19171.1 ornithine carbamoyltransferase [bacterium]